MANTITVMPAEFQGSFYSPDMLENIWKQCFESQMNPFISILCIDGSLYRMLDAGAKRYIALRFMEHVPEQVMYCIDGTGIDRVYLGAPRHFVTGQGMVLSPAGSDPIWIMRPMVPAGDASSSSTSSSSASAQSQSASSASFRIPRPPNAYILYRKERHHLIKDANPGITNNEISQILGKAWNIESREIRFKYKEMADRIKNALLKKYPHYKYCPRRPCERRRRARQSGNIENIASIGTFEANAGILGNIDFNANIQPSNEN